LINCGRGKGKMCSDLDSICQDLLNNSAPILRMRGRPDFSSWAEALRSWANKEELASFDHVLRALADNALTDLEPLQSFLAGHNPTNFRNDQERWAFEHFFKAVIFAFDRQRENKYAAFILTLVVALAWMRRCDDDLYDLPHNDSVLKGWCTIVPVLALTSFKAGAIPQADLIVRGAYEMFITLRNKMPTPWKPLQEGARQIRERYGGDLGFLAEELRDSCRTKQPNFRPEVGAILWSLGMIPESLLFHANVPVPSVPSRTFCKRVINQSLASIPKDPMVQYVWLLLKDREPFNIRDHYAFFGIIDRAYETWNLDNILAYYARTLIAWFRGESTKEEAYKYIDSYQLWCSAEIPGYTKIPGFIKVRLLAMAKVLAEQFDLFAGEAAKAVVEDWSELLRFVTEMRLKPDIAERTSSLMGPSFYHIKRADSPTAASQTGVPVGDELQSAIAALEEYRTSAMAYWLDVVPPLPAEHEKAVVELLDEEENLLVGLRGAYFLIIYAQLPQTFRHYTYEMSAPQLHRSESAGIGRKEYEDIRAALQALWERMTVIAPSYAAARRSPVADLDMLLAAMSVPATRV
jgi:hypothetical protein